MKIQYKSKKDEEFYTTKNALKASFGLPMAEKIIMRIDQLQTAKSFQHLPRNARLHEHTGSRKGLFSLDLVHPYRLIVEGKGKYTHYFEISTIEIYEVMDPH